jgi:hypothetical protein
VDEAAALNMTEHLSREALLASLQTRKLDREDLIGLPYISYLRFSSKPQEKGSTIPRQREVLNQIVTQYQLVREADLEDRGLSAIKNRHVEFGQLGVLLGMIREGVITPARPIVLIIEQIDRLFRRGQFDAFDVLRQLIRDGGMILVTGDLLIWNEYAINSPESVVLTIGIAVAKAEAKRMVDKATGAHKERFKLMEALEENPDGPKPKLAGRPPAWIIRDILLDTTSLHPVHAETVRLIFRLYRAGFSTNQIARQLNRDGVPILGDIPKAGHVCLEWSSNKVGAILRDRSVLGLVQPHHMVNGKRVAIGGERKVYPPVIEAGDWLAVQDMLNARGNALRGRKGTLANLFTSKIFCFCGGAMRVDTGAGGPGRHRVRKFQCARYVGGRTCQHDTRYPVPKWEAVIVDQIIEHSRLVPRQNVVPLHGQSIADVRMEIANLDEQIAVVEPRIGKSASMAERWEVMCERRDVLLKTADTLALEAQAAQSSTTRHPEVHRFMQDVRGPALRGDRDARERLRGLLSKIDFKVVFGTIPHGITLTVGDWSDTFPDGRDSKGSPG